MCALDGSSPVRHGYGDVCAGAVAMLQSVGLNSRFDAAVGLRLAEREPSGWFRSSA